MVLVRDRVTCQSKMTWARRFVWDATRGVRPLLELSLLWTCLDIFRKNNQKQVVKWPFVHVVTLLGTVWNL